jgi:hypothetical protein
MNISLPENLTKQVRNAETFLEQGINTAVKNINQDTQQAKTLVIERTNQTFESINEAKENAITNLAKAADTTVNSITEKSSQIAESLTATTIALEKSLQTTIDKIDKLNQTLSDGIQASISSSLGNWMINHPKLVWIIDHPLEDLGIIFLFLVLLSGLFRTISGISEKLWILILIYPFKLISNVVKSFLKVLPKDTSQDTNKIEGKKDQLRFIELLNQLETNRQEQKLILQELELILKSKSTS